MVTWWRRRGESSLMISRRSVILALGSMPLLANGVFCQTAVKARRVGLLSSGAPFADASEIVTGLTAGFSKRGYVVGSSLFERRGGGRHPGRLAGVGEGLKAQGRGVKKNGQTRGRVV